MDSKTINALDKYFTSKIIDDLIANIYDLPKWMERGLELVYPEKQEAFLEFLLEKAKSGSGICIQNALDVMEALENGATIEEADELVEDYGNFSKQITRGYVLEWSKRGPEYYKKTLGFPLKELKSDVLNQIDTIENMNKKYEMNARLRETDKENNKPK